MTRSRVWFVLVPLAALLAWHLLAMQRVRALAGEALYGFAECCEVTLGPGFYRWNGDIGVRQVRIIPKDPAYGEPVEIGEAVLHTPGFWWTQRAFFGGKPRKRGLRGRVGSAVAGRSADPLPPADGLSVELINARLGMPDLLPDFLAHLGSSTAMPFEAEGCEGDVWWTPAEMPLLGLPDDPVTLTWGYRRASEAAVEVYASLEAPGRGRARYAELVRSAEPDRYLFTEETTETVQRQELILEDLGFQAARNRYCASRDGVEPAEFAARHLRSVHRQLLAWGLKATPELEEVYADWLHRGGELRLLAEPHPSVPPERYAAYPASQRWELWNGVLMSGGAKAPVRLSPTTPREIPDSFSGSTWDLVAIESLRGLEVGAGAFNGSGTLSLPEPGRRSPRRDAVPVAAANTPIARLEDLPMASAPLRVLPDRLAISELPSHIGRPVRVVDVMGRVHLGHLQRVDASSLTLKVRMRSGHAEYALDLKRVRQVEPDRRG